MEEGGRWGRQRPIWVRSGRTTANGAATLRLPREGGGEMMGECNEKNTREKAKKEEEAVERNIRKLMRNMKTEKVTCRHTTKKNGIKQY